MAVQRYQLPTTMDGRRLQRDKNERDLQCEDQEQVDEAPFPDLRRRRAKSEKAILMGPTLWRGANHPTPSTPRNAPFQALQFQLTLRLLHYEILYAVFRHEYIDQTGQD